MMREPDADKGQQINGIMYLLSLETGVKVDIMYFYISIDGYIRRHPTLFLQERGGDWTI